MTITRPMGFCTSGVVAQLERVPVAEERRLVRRHGLDDPLGDRAVGIGAQPEPEAAFRAHGVLGDRGAHPAAVVGHAQEAPAGALGLDRDRL
mgnify:CR=1 FL=1